MHKETYVYIEEISKQNLVIRNKNLVTFTT